MKTLVLGLAILGYVGLSIKKKCIGRTFYLVGAGIMLVSSVVNMVEKFLLSGFLMDGLTYETAMLFVFAVIGVSCICFAYLTEEGSKSLKCLLRKAKNQ